MSSKTPIKKSTSVRDTKKLRTLLERYEVPVRDERRCVTHLLKRTRTECDPLTFAAFEAVIKSEHLSNALYALWSGDLDAGFEQHYQRIAHAHGFVLLDPYMVPEAEREDRGQEAANDRSYFVTLIMNAGLYFELLD
jgi:hypothetical protein